ncbi:MAG: Multi-sensor Hybrid Histidine Kinase [Phycisphaerales bacterium]|nr:Multi-sensor Hybrid Histidine Kinase [Phycisphaerales bacterium]
MAALKNSIETGEDYVAEYRIGTSDAPRWAYARARVEHDASGKPARLAGVVQDVTDRKTAEQSLSITQDRYRNLFDSIDQGFCVLKLKFDDAGRGNDYYYEEVNPAFERQTGLKNAAGLWMRQIVPDLEPYWPELYGRVLQTGEPVRAENEVASLGRWFDVYGFRVGTAEQPRVAVLFSDITAQRQAIVAIRESEARFRQLADTMPQIVWAARADGTLDYYNRRWFNFIDRPDEIDPAAPDVRWDSYVHADDLPRAGLAWTASLQTGKPYEIEFRVRDGHGEYHWFLVRALPVHDEDGRVIRWYGTCTDVDEQKAAEMERERLAEQRRMALDAANLGWWHLDPASGDVFFDEGFKSIFGVSADRLAYESVIGLMHPDDRERVNIAVLAATRPDDPQPYAIDYRVMHGDGTVRWVQANGRAYYTGEGPARQYTAFVGTIADITQRVHADAERQALLDSERAARADAERASRMKDDFLATLSHELRTPLNAIVGWSQILASSTNDPGEVAEGLAVIERNARAQTQIIEDILDMSRIVSGKLRLDVQPVDVASLVRAGVETVQPAADAKGIRLQTVIDPLAAEVAGDSSRLHQVFWNLISNAVKFTPRGGQVQVRLARVASHVEVSVVDSGEGIDLAFCRTCSTASARPTAAPRAVTAAWDWGFRS